MRRILSGLLTAGVVLGTAGVAAATTQYPAIGGTWEYGNGMVIAYSYYTVDASHGSSVKRGAKMMSDSGCIATNRKSIAEVRHAPWTHGYSYFYRKC